MIAKHRTPYRLTEIPEVAYIIPAPAKNGCRVWRPETVTGATAPRPYTGAFFMPETDVSVMAVCVGNSTELPGTCNLGSPTPRTSSPTPPLTQLQCQTYHEALSKDISGFRTRQQCGFFVPAPQAHASYGGTTTGEYNTFGEYPVAVTYVTESESRRLSQNMAASHERHKEPHMANIITADFNGISVTFKNNAYLNASEIAAYFGKAPKDYLKTEQTQAYIAALAQSLANRTKIPFKENQLVTVKKGAPSTGGGTWLHPKLAVHFARWLSPEFAVWCDAQIERILGINQENHIKARPSKTRKALPGGLTLEQQDSIKALHRELVKAAPKDLQGKLAIRLWSAIKSKYGVTYKEVPPTEYAEILSLMARTAQEMPLLVEEKPAHIAVMDFDTRRDGEWRVYIRDGKAYRLAAMYATVQGDPYAPR